MTAPTPKPPRRFNTVYDLYPEIDRARNPAAFPDIRDKFFWDVFDKCKPFTMLSVEAIYNIYRSVEHIVANRVPGDFVECGVFLGGAVLAMSEFAHHFALRDRRFFLYDTFAGFPSNISDTRSTGQPVDFVPYLDCQDVVSTVLATSVCPMECFEMIPGKVEETLRDRKPASIALLRLDTDYYESTKVELTELYPRLSSGGIFIVDDYGWMQGSRRATDEYLSQQPHHPMLFRVSQAVRAGVKP